MDRIVIREIESYKKALSETARSYEAWRKKAMAKDDCTINKEKPNENLNDVKIENF